MPVQATARTLKITTIFPQKFTSRDLPVATAEIAGIQVDRKCGASGERTRWELGLLETLPEIDRIQTIEWFAGADKPQVNTYTIHRSNGEITYRAVNKSRVSA